MKLIQILVLAVAVAAAAPAQNATTGQNSGPSNGTDAQKKTAPKTVSSQKGSSKSDGSTSKSGIGLVVPAPGSKTAPSKSPASAKGTTSATASSKSGSQPGSTNTKPGAKPGIVQKAPVLTAKPAQIPAGRTKSTSTAVNAKKTPPKAAGAKPEKQVKIVSQKTDAKKQGDKAGPITVSAAGRRDPFLSVIRNMPVTGSTGPNCSVGKRCLFIPELELKGIAKDPDGQMLAVVVSNTHRAYFLRENDQVFNGSVQRITSDSVVFREFATDHLGRETAHEVVKRIPKS